MMLLSPWDKRMAYGEHLREEVRSREMQLRNFFANVDVALRRGGPEAGSQKWGPDESAVQAALAAAQAAVHAKLLDNLDTRGAMDALADIIKAVNIYLEPRQGSAGLLPRGFLVRACAAYVTRILSVFGLAPGPGDVLGLPAEGASGAVGMDGAAGVLDAFCGFRDEVRRLARAAAPAKELLAASDAVRDGAMVDLGIRLEDLPDGGSIWKPDDPAALRAERAQKQRAAVEARAKKVRAKAEATRRDLEKFEKLAALPSPQDVLKEKYAAFDPVSGDPTQDASGAALEGKALDKARKEMEKARKVRAPLEKRLAEEGAGFFDALRAEAEALEAQLAAMQLET